MVRLGISAVPRTRFMDAKLTSLDHSVNREVKLRRRLHCASEAERLCRHIHSELRMKGYWTNSLNI